MRENILNDVTVELYSVLNKLSYYDVFKDKLLLNSSQLKDTLHELEFKSDLIKRSQEYVQNAIDLVYSKGFDVIERAVNEAIQTIFYDKKYTFSIKLESKRGSKSAFLEVVDMKTGQPISVSDGMGQGVRAVISFVLQFYYVKLALNVVSKDAPVILIYDEVFSSVSDAYLDSFFDYIAAISSSDIEFYMVLVTHDSRLLKYAKRVYEIQDGIVNVIE